jgi:thiol-disulfide isomerase/thioredoxin
LAFRLGLLVVLITALPALYLVVRAGAVLRRRRVIGAGREPGLSQGQPTLLFFTGEQCSICKYRQAPAIERLKQGLDGPLRVVELDAAREQALVRRFNVLSLPTTVLLAADGRVGAVNYGFAPGEQLRAQVAGLV